MQIVRARAEQAAILSQVAWKAKAAWKYPAHWMDGWRATLDIQPEQIEANHYFAAQVDGRIVGFCGLHPADKAWQLEHLWVLPEHWRSGVGRQLYFHAVGFARLSNARGVVIDSDPNAEGFYLRMGAKRLGGLEVKVDGRIRILPQLLYSLSQ